VGSRFGGWPTFRHNAIRFESSNKLTGGAPLLALFEKWACYTADTVVVLVLGSRRSNLHLQHPVVDFHRARFPQNVRSKAAPLPKFWGRHSKTWREITPKSLIPKDRAGRGSNHKTR
jgi:hypothetical protein